MKKIDIKDENGFPIRVVIPDDYPAERVNEGIRVSLDLRELFPEVPDYFNARLQEQLWLRDLIEPADFLKGGARERIMEAFRAVERYDANQIIEYSMEAVKK